MKTVKLYGYATSPYVRKVGCFLYYKGIEFEHIPVNPINPAQTIGHTNGTQVPVLEIDGDYRRESSELAFWLDELFPEKPLCPEEHGDKIKEIDAWVSSTFLISIFRAAIDGELDLDMRFRAWRLAALVSAHTPLPEHIRNKWPDLLKLAPFIQAMKPHMDLTESAKDMNLRIGMELMGHIGEGPYMGGLEAPTMLDLAVFPQLVWGYMFGLEKHLSAARSPVIKAWMRRVYEHLPANPTLVLDEMLVNKLAPALMD